MFNPRLLAGSILLIFLLAGCAETPSSCPRYERIELTEADNYSGDEDQPFGFPLDDFNLYRRIYSAKFADSGFVSPGVREYHAAEDLYHPPGTPVYAMADGKVSFSGPMGGYGWLIIIDHPQANLYSLYGHLSPSWWRKELGPVEKGELIAYLGDPDENGGSSENPLRPHLHFGVRAGQRADYPGSGIRGEVGGRNSTHRLVHVWRREYAYIRDQEEQTHRPDHFWYRIPRGRVDFLQQGNGNELYALRDGRSICGYWNL